MRPRAPLNHTSHWGAFRGEKSGEDLVVSPNPDDPAPSPILANIASAVRHKARVTRPLIRRGWLENGPGASSARGGEDFVAVPWDEAIDRVSAELRRVYDRYGGSGVYGGSYGWSSAGRFHHAQSQIHRFLNCLGGYVRSVNSYSAGAAAVILPHILGPFDPVYLDAVRLDEIAEHCDLILAFGGMAAKNTAVCGGGVSRHLVPGALERIARRGTAIHLVSPLRSDIDPGLSPVWHSITPGTDTALMLGIAHTLLTRGWHDNAFLASHCTGFESFSAYLTGAADGEEKSARWAGAICGLPEKDILELAALLPGRRVLVTTSQSLQRAEHGEQPIWMAVVLAAMLGQIGRPGGGYSYGLGSMADAGLDRVSIRLPTLDQLQNPIPDYIPVARVSDMLLHPGQTFDYNGKLLRYPDIRLVYWAGGNPFHHHQDLGRLARAFERPDTIIVHDSAFTATARHADIVLPATLTVEREDIGASRNDPLLIPMHRLIEPMGEARDDYAIFSAIAREMGCENRFTNGWTAREWLRHLYGKTVEAAEAQGWPLPDFDGFWQSGGVTLPTRSLTGGMFADFRRDPENNPLSTPSGRIEIASSTIAGFGYPDCPGHPAWLDKNEGHGSPRQRQYRYFLIANQPATRLHSQLDFGAHSAASKVSGREPIRLNPGDAAHHGITEGDIVRVFNDRGAFLAGAVLSEDIRPGVLQIATGAWYAPAPGSATPFCLHGNPNTVTFDRGTSRLAQGSTGQLCLVDFDLWRGPLPELAPYDIPLAPSEDLPMERPWLG